MVGTGAFRPQFDASPAPALPRAPLLDFRGDQEGEIEQDYRQEQNGEGYPGPQFGAGDQPAEQPHDHLPVKDDMDHQHPQEGEGQVEVDSPPIVPVHSPQVQFHVAAVNRKGLFSGNQDVFHQKAQAGDGHEENKHQASMMRLSLPFSMSGPPVA